MTTNVQNVQTVEDGTRENPYILWLQHLPRPSEPTCLSVATIQIARCGTKGRCLSILRGSILRVGYNIIPCFCHVMRERLKDVVLGMRSSILVGKRKKRGVDHL